MINNGIKALCKHFEKMFYNNDGGENIQVNIREKNFFINIQ